MDFVTFIVSVFFCLTGFCWILFVFNGFLAKYWRNIKIQINTYKLVCHLLPLKIVVSFLASALKSLMEFLLANNISAPI